jgi:hypothetical protein
MTGNAKEMLAKLREKACPIAKASLGRAKAGAASAHGYVRSVAGRMTVKERLLVLFAVGVVLGFGIKTTAGGFVTIGFQDYSVKGKGQAYDLNELERRVAEKSAVSSSEEVDPTTSVAGGQCQ